MEISALAQSLSSQTMMGMLLVKVLDQAQQMVQEQAAIVAAKTTEISDAMDNGTGENLDVVA